MLLVAIIIGAVLTVIVMSIGLLLAEREQAPAQLISRPQSPPLDLPPVFTQPPPNLHWTRPRITPLALTRWNASRHIFYGLGLFLVLPAILLPLLPLILIFWSNELNASDLWGSLSDLPLLPDTFQLSYLIVLLIPCIQVWILIQGVKKWQKIKTLEEQGQLTWGVILDRWSGFSRRSTYSVAYYFYPPGANPEAGPVVRAEGNRAAYEAYWVGDPVKVRYLPENPQVCRLEL